MSRKSPPVPIYVTSAVGYGQTTLSAFDDALSKSGVSNLNLVRYSSIIPPRRVMVLRKPPLSRVPYGHELKVVYAEMRSEHVGELVAAGVGWNQDQKTLKGVLVEHEGHDEAEVDTDILLSLEDLKKRRPELSFGKDEKFVLSKRCDGTPICVFVAAVFGYNKPGTFPLARRQ